MATLAELVAGKTLAEARAYLAETITAPNPERINTAKIMARMSIDDARAVLGRLQQASALDPLVAEGLIQLRDQEGGMDLSHANAQTMIDQLFSDNPELAARVKALGTQQVTRAEANGLGRVKDGHILEVL